MVPDGVSLGECIRARPGGAGIWFARWSAWHVVVKRGRPAPLHREAAALTALAPAAVTMLWCSSVPAPDGLATLVTERVLLGDDLYPLIEGDDDGATREIARLILRMHGAATPRGRSQPLPPLSEIAAILDIDDPRLPADLVARARATVAELATGECVLHGDLHHGNAVRRGPDPVDGRSTWVAIDPHGWLGDPVFDAAPALANPRSLPAGDPLGPTLRRVAILAEETGWDRERIRAWAFAGAVLAEAILLRDHGLVHGGPLALARALADAPRAAL